MSLAEKGHKFSSDLFDTEIRLLDASKITKLSSILDRGDSWRRLLEELSKQDSGISDDDYRPSSRLNLTSENVSIIERQIFCGNSPSLALLNHWSITGRRRPTVRSLISYLNICNLKWAEEFVYESILGLEKKLLSHKTSLVIPEKIVSNHGGREIHPQFRFEPLTDFLNQIKIEWPKYEFTEIYKSTNGFCDKPYNHIQATGSKVGEGRFSSVYRSTTRPQQVRQDTQELKDDSIIVAAKLLKSDCNMIYLMEEINLMSRLNHPNLLQLLGISVGLNSDDDEPRYLCLIYPYFENGSLLDCLSLGISTDDNRSLTSIERFYIGNKIAQAIDYLHSFKPSPLLHRDIKTANIFVNRCIEPKLGDFTLLCQCDEIKNSESNILQSSIIGTSVYMAPETFQGDVSTKSDAFSFGIVILELLSGMKPCDDNIDEDLFTYVTERLADIQDNELDQYEAHIKLLLDILDTRAGNWDMTKAETFFTISLKLTQSRKIHRADIGDIIHQLKELCL